MRLTRNNRAIGISTTAGAILVLVIILVGAAVVYYGVASGGAAAGSSNVVTQFVPPTHYNVTILSGASTNKTASGYLVPKITISIGDTITWTNKDNATHTVVADDGSFNSNDIAPGQTYTHTFSTAGTFTYHCKYHSWMQGTVVVQ